MKLKAVARTILFCSVAASIHAIAQSDCTGYRDIAMSAVPLRNHFRSNSAPAVKLTLRNLSGHTVLVPKELVFDDFIVPRIVGPDGKELRWRGKLRSLQYAQDAFLGLEPGYRHSDTVSLAMIDGTGFDLKQPGRYSATFELSMSPPEYFASIVGKGKPPACPVSSNTVTFFVDTK